MSRFYLPSVFCLMLLFSGVSIAAQEASLSPFLEDDYLAELPLVLTATRLEQPRTNSPVATTIITREMIDASGFTEIADLMKLAPGMLVNYDSGHIANVGYPFLFDRYRVRLQVLIDGMSVYTPSFGEMPWTQLGITIDDIERIEVIRGPSSASYGPNAMTGVISIITRHAALDSGVRARLNQGSNGRSEQFLTYGGGTDNVDYHLSLGARQDDGFERRYDNKDQLIANFRSEIQASNSDVITLSVFHNDGEYQEDATASLNPSMPQHLKNVNQTYLQGNWVHTFTNGDAFSLKYYHQSFDDENRYVGDFTADGFGMVPIDEGTTTDRKNLEFLYTADNENFSVTTGVLYRIDNTLSPQYLFNVDRDIRTSQFFVNSAFNIDRANIINIDVLYDDNDTGGATSSPRVAWNHHFNDSHTVRLSYAESTRSPFALEEYTNRVVYVPLFSSDVTVWSDLSDLEPEKIKSLDLGYLVNLNESSTKMDFRIYKSEISDLIVQDWTVGTGGFLQGDAFHITGFEATFSQQLEQTNLTFNYARTKIVADELVYGDPVWYESGSPDTNFSLLIRQKFNNRYYASIGHYYTGSYQQLCCESDFQAARIRTDVTISKRFKLGKYQSRLRFVAQNIFNNEVETRLFNNYDRQWYVSFSIEE